MDLSHAAGGRRPQSRLGPGLLALTVQGGLALIVLAGFSVRTPSSGSHRSDLPAITTIRISDPPPIPKEQPDRGEPAGTLGPEGKALPIEAPPSKFIIAESFAAPSAGEGTDVADGANQEGTGAGAGGEGSGSGSGDGSGRGRISPAVRIEGAIKDADYPREARNQHAEGTVVIGFRVRTDGRVDQCQVISSSGHFILDRLTCRLVAERFRFRPAMQADGTPIPIPLETSFTWGMRPPVNLRWPIDYGCPGHRRHHERRSDRFRA